MLQISAFSPFLPVSLSPSTVFYPHFMVPCSVCLPLYRSSLLLTPALVLLAVLFLPPLPLSILLPLNFCLSLFFFDLVLKKNSRVLQTQFFYTDRICIIFSPAIRCSRHILLSLLCDDYLPILFHLKRKTGHLSKRREEKAILVTAEEAPFSDSRGDVKNVLSASEIDGGESLSLLRLL